MEVETNQGETAETPREQLIEPVDEAHVSQPAAASRTLNEDEVVTHRVMPPFFKLIAWVVGIVILAVLIVFFARWIYHKVHHNTANPPSTTLKLPARSSNARNQGAQSSPSGSTSSPSPSSPSTSSSPSQNNNLPNSGPGQTMAIFAGASLVAAGIHYVIAERRARQP